MRNLVAGGRLVFFRPVSVLDFRLSAADFALLFAFNVLIWFAGGYLRAGGSATPNFAALPGMLVQVPYVLLAALLIAAVYRRSELLLVLAVMWIAGDWVFEIALLVMTFGFAGESSVLPRWLGPMAGNVYTLWALVVLWRAIWIGAGRARPQLFYAIALITAFFAFIFIFAPRAEPWTERRDDPAASTDLSAGNEEVFHLQPTLMAEALSTIEAGRPGAIDLYFIGMAGHAPQNVFLNEVTAVEKLFTERFGVKGRAVSLINSASTLREAPIATMTNLHVSLRGLAQLMNRDEDVLFLFITTHGDRAHRLSFEMAPLELRQPTPTSLARMLSESGIKWKVIVISACFSGGYVEPLADANTLIITASSADQSSFGCEHGRDWTYFGEAFFRDALASTHSFTGAFEAARLAIAEREKREGLEPSEPQIRVGAAISERLPAIEAALKASRNLSGR